MNRLFLLTLLFVVTSADSLFAQVTLSKSLFVDGYIKDQNNQDPIVNVIVHFKTDRGDIQETESDTAGYFAFRFSVCTFTQAQLYVSLSKKSHGIKQTCNCYLGNPEVKSFSVDSSKHVVANFFFNQFFDCLCQPMPRFVFKKNTTEMNRLKYSEPEDSVYCFPEWNLLQLAKIMKNEPTVVIQLDGHADTDEALAAELSLLRAERVKSELIRLGINPDRIVARGWGSTKPLVKPEIIKKAKTDADKESLRTINRRCVFRVLNWDYKPEPSTPH